MAKTYDDEDGVWRTVGGRRIFIRNGQSLGDAMKESGKFNTSKAKEDKPANNAKEAADKYMSENYEKKKKEMENWLEKSKEIKGEDDTFKKATNDNEKDKEQKSKDAFGLEKEKAKIKDFDEKEYEQYKQMRENMSAITDEENDTFTKLDNKYEEMLNKEPAYITEYRGEYAVISRGGIQGLYKTPEEAHKMLGDKLMGAKSIEERDKIIEDNRKNMVVTDFARPKAYDNDQFEVGDLKKKAMEKLPKEDIDTHEGDLYLKKTKESTELLENMKNKDSGMLSTFRDQQTGEEWYDIPFANMNDDYKEKQAELEKNANDIINNNIREKASKKTKAEPNLPKRTEIKEQGTSNRKEVSENIQAHILDYYDDPQDFVEQMEYMNEPNMWRAGEELAAGGSYAIYYEDQREFLDSLKINPKGKEFSDDKVFDTYKSLIGRESAKLYDRLKRNAYNEYKREHPLSKMTFDEFKNQK